MSKILQITAAPAGWRAMFADGDDHDSRYTMEAISCWAVVERDGGTEVVGVCGWDKQRLCCDIPGFLGYQEPAKQDDSSMKEWRNISRDYHLSNRPLDEKIQE